jgi:hypothetical protein
MQVGMWTGFVNGSQNIKGIHVAVKGLCDDNGQACGLVSLGYCRVNWSTGKHPQGPLSSYTVII